VAGKAGTLADGARMAEAAIDSGKAAETLARLVTISNG
jgi:anthranilate phosphoribosyltransferase